MITYQVAACSDLMRVTKLLCEIDKTFPIPLSKKTDISILAQKFIEKGVVWLATEDQTPVGMIGFYANDTQTRSAYISVLGVVETHQRRGIARQLLTYALALCKKQGMAACVLYTHKTNAGAIALYEKLGFVAQEDPERPNDIRFVKKI